MVAQRHGGTGRYGGASRNSGIPRLGGTAGMGQSGVAQSGMVVRPSAVIPALKGTLDPEFKVLNSTVILSLK